MMNPRKRKLNAIHEAGETKLSKVQVASTRTSKIIDDRPISRNTGTASGLRVLLADLKSGPLSHTPVTERLEVLSQRSFPRCEEWTLMYLTNVLAKEKQDSHELNATWLALISMMDKISIERLQVLLKKVDFVAFLPSYFQAAVSSHDALTSIIEMIQRFLKLRTTRRLLATTFERAAAALLSCLNLLSLSSCDASFCGPLIDILLYHVKQQSNYKKLIDFMRTQGLQALAKLLNTREALSSCERLLQHSIFSETELHNLNPTKEALSFCGTDPGMEHLCSISFLCTNVEIKHHSKRLVVRNALLEMWLSLVDRTQADRVLTIYKTSQTGLNITRPLSTDAKIRDALQQTISTVLTSPESNAAVLSTLLEIDLDLLLPSHEEALWSYVDKRQDTDLLAKCLQAYVDIRSLPSFFESVSKLKRATTSLLTDSVSNTLANETSRLTVTVQDEIMQTILQSTSVLKAPLLVSFIGGLPSGSSILQKSFGDLSTLEHHTELKRLIALKSKTMSIELVNPIDRKTIASAPECEAWLRAVELQVDIDGQGTDQKQHLEQIDALLTLASENTKFLVAVLRRWAPAVVPLMSSSQKLRFVQVILSEVDDTTATETILTQSRLLEIPELHAPLQDELLRLLHTNATFLLAIPTDFFHKAVKRQIVTSLVSTQLMDNTKCQILLKYAHAGILPTFSELGDYLKFAITSLDKSLGTVQNTDTISAQLRRVYIKTLSQSQCLRLLEDASCNSILRLEVFEECSTDQHLLEAGQNLALATRDGVFNNGNTFEDKHQQVVVLLRLLKTFRKLEVSTSFLSMSQTQTPVAQWLSFSDIADQNRSTQMTHTCYELAAWQVETVNDAQNVLSAALADNTFAADFLDKLFCGFVHSLSAEVLQSLLDVQPSGSSTTHRSRLLLKVLQNSSRNDVLSSAWIRLQFRNVCDGLAQSQELLIDFDVLQTILETHARALDTTSMDQLCACIQQCLIKSHVPGMVTTTTKIHRLLRATFQHHAYRLKDRYHIVILLFQRLLTVCLSTSDMAKHETESLVRLFETFLTSSRSLSLNPEQFNRAFAKHVPWLLIEYTDAITSSSFSDKISVQTKKTIEENLIYECMGLCGQHEREMVGTSLDSAGRGMFKRLYEEWSRFGRWTER